MVLRTNYCIRIRTSRATSRASQLDCSIIDTNVLMLNVNLNGFSVELFKNLEYNFPDVLIYPILQSFLKNKTKNKRY